MNSQWLDNFLFDWENPKGQQIEWCEMIFFPLALQIPKNMELQMIFGMESFEELGDKAIEILEFF